MDWQEFLLAGYEMSQLWMIALAIVLGTCLQASVGFGLALCAMPIMLWAGIELHQAMVFAMVTQVSQQITGLAHVRREMRWRPVIPVIAAGLLFLGVGVALQRQCDRQLLSRIIGGVILGTVLLQLLWPPAPRPRLHPIWGLLAGGCAGGMSGLVSLPGPPIVVWAMAHDWSNPRTRGSMWAVFLSFVPVQFVLLWIAFGDTVPRTAVPAAGLIPVALVGTTVGLRIGSRISKRRLRQAAFVLLLILGACALLL